MLRPKKASIRWDPRRNRYVVRVWWQGKYEAFYQYEGVSHGTAEIARLHKAEIETEIKKKVFDPVKHKKRQGPKSPYLFSEYSNLWLREYEERIKTEDVSKEYVAHLQRYIALLELGSFDIREINEITIKETYLMLSQKGYSKKHIQNIMDALRKLFRDAYEGSIIKEPIKFPQYRMKRRDSKWISEDAWLSMEDQDLTLSHIPGIHKPIVTTIFYHGLRLAEARFAKRTNFNANEETLYVETLKGGPGRKILLEPQCLELIQSMPPTIRHPYLFHWHGKPYSKTKLWKVIREALDEAGFKDVTPNQAGRHSFGSNRTAMGQPSLELQYEMGHADVRTTRIYTHVRVEN